MQLAGLISKFSGLLSTVARIFRRLRRPIVASPAIDPLPPPPPPAEPPPEPPPAEASLPEPNRATRRRLERARRRKDKFVKPKGPEPSVIERSTPPIRPKRSKDEPPPTFDVEETDDIIYEKHHSDGELVLYEEAEMYGEFNFRDTILEQLDRYFVYLTRMRKASEDEYQFYRQVGATILPYAAVYEHFADDESEKEDRKHKEPEGLPEWFKLHRPSFGCFVYGADPHLEKRELELSKKVKTGSIWIPKFMSFCKYESPPPELEATSGGDVYKMTVWWDRPHDPDSKVRNAHPQEFGIFVSRDGDKVRILRMKETRRVWIPSKRHGGGYIGGFYKPDSGWHIPHDYEEWAMLHHKDVQLFLGNLFCASVKRMEYSNFSMVRVAATRGDMTAVFGVNIKRMSYFFQDRDVTLNEHGVKKRVFHIVRAHTRKDGHTVPFHFRGEREFTWAGYQILITVPGRDHVALNEFDRGFVDEELSEPGHKYLNLPEFGARLAALVDWKHRHHRKNGLH